MLFDLIAQLNLKNHYILKHVTVEKEDYKVEQLHFHWSHSNDSGSEHLLEGKSYPLEVIFYLLIINFKNKSLFRCISLLIQVYF